MLSLGEMLIKFSFLGVELVFLGSYNSNITFTYNRVYFQANLIFN
jgi:hypothetical protein